MRRYPLFFSLFLLMPGGSAMAAENVHCHYSYGGETKTLTIRPDSEPYRASAPAVGSFFRFRAVIESEPEVHAAVKTYVYEARDGGPVLLHQGSYPWPVIEGEGQRHGFTGLQRVYEPVYGSEFEYWCSVTDSGRDRK